MKLPVMKFDLDNDTIVDAVRAAVEAGGITLGDKHVRITFKTKRVGPDAGLSATVEVSSDPFLETPVKPTAKRGPKPKNTAVANAVVEEVAQDTEAAGAAVTEEAATKEPSKKKPLFEASGQ